jgi:hypothetical protein
MQKSFKDLILGETFKMNNVDYIKVAEVKVSCCKSINAHIVGDPNQRTFFPPGTPVEVNA